MVEVRQLGVIAAAHVVDYARLMGDDEFATLTALQAHREAIDPVFAGEGGRIVKTGGGCMLLEFPSAFDAMRAALAAQRLMAERNAELAPEQRLLFRIGIHAGDIVVNGHGLSGDGVDTAIRLQAIAEPGGICLSEPVRERIHRNIDALFGERHNKRLEDRDAPVRAYNLPPDGLPMKPVAPPLPVTSPRAGSGVAIRQPSAVVEPDSVVRRPEPAASRAALSSAVRMPARAPHADLPWLWSFSLTIAALALVAAIVLAMIGVERSLVVLATSWVLLIAGATQIVSVVAARRRRSS
jgi:class 3 adenylate cyclase